MVVVEVCDITLTPPPLPPPLCPLVFALVSSFFRVSRAFPG